MAKRKLPLKRIPEFSTEAEERAFWETHDSTEYVAWSRAQFRTFPNAKPSTETTSRSPNTRRLQLAKGRRKRKDA
jgi:hypothetical protein